MCHTPLWHVHWFRAWFRHLDAHPDPEQLDWKSFKICFLKNILDSRCQTQRTFCSLETSNSLGPNLQLSHSAWGGGKVQFASVFWELLRWIVFPLPRVPLSAMSTQRGVGEEGEALGWVERAADVAAGLCGVLSECWFLLLWMPLGNAEASTCMLVLQKCGFYFLKWIVVPKKSFSFFKASSEKSNCMGWKWGDYSVCKESCTW